MNPSVKTATVSVLLDADHLNHSLNIPGKRSNGILYRAEDRRSSL
jgi:hypothetical protein